VGTAIELQGFAGGTVAVRRRRGRALESAMAVAAGAVPGIAVEIVGGKQALAAIVGAADAAEENGRAQEQTEQDELET
jgi:hypothetical protein